MFKRWCLVLAFLFAVATGSTEALGQRFQSYRVSPGIYSLNGMVSARLPAQCLDRHLPAATPQDSFRGTAGMELRRIDNGQTVQTHALTDAIANGLVEVVGTSGASSVDVQPRNLPEGHWELVVHGGAIVAETAEHVEAKRRRITDASLARFYERVDEAEANLAAVFRDNSPVLSAFRERVLYKGWDLQSREAETGLLDDTAFNDVTHDFSTLFDAPSPELALARLCLVAGEIPDAPARDALSAITGVQFAAHLSPELHAWFTRITMDAELVGSLGDPSLAAQYLDDSSRKIRTGNLDGARDLVRRWWDDGTFLGGAPTRDGVELWLGRALEPPTIAHASELLGIRLESTAAFAGGVLVKHSGGGDRLTIHRIGARPTEVDARDVASLRRAIAGCDTLFVEDRPSPELLAAARQADEPASLIVDWGTYVREHRRGSKIALILALPTDATEAARMFPNVASKDALDFTFALRSLSGARMVKSPAELRTAVAEALRQGMRPTVVANNVNWRIEFREPMAIENVLVLGADIITCNSCLLPENGMRIVGEVHLESLAEAFEAVFKQSNVKRNGGGGAGGDGGNGGGPPDFGSFWQWARHYAARERAKERKRTKGWIALKISAGLLVLLDGDDDDEDDTIDGREAEQGEPSRDGDF